MALIYSSTNKIKFGDISELYSVPKKYKARLSSLHGALILYVTKHFQNTRKYKQKVVDAANILTYCVMFNETPPFDWRVDDPLATMPPQFDLDMIADELGDYLLTVDAVEWNLNPVEVIPQTVSSDTLSTLKQSTPKVVSATTRALGNPAPRSTKKWVDSLTPKEDLYLQAPRYPMFDYSKPWLSIPDREDQLVIYTTLPEIPTTQNEISVTTDVSKMTDAELMNLYPNHLITTRPAVMYEQHPGMEYDEDLGCILPIQGFTSKQIIDNIIKYPHFYKLKRLNEEVLSSFYQDIELDGELYSVSAIWDSLPESEIIPKQSDFIKEYVVRRYLLERDNGIRHNYPMYGSLDPYLTLFMPPERYVQKGYTALVEMARQCVQSRVSFKQTRNPIIKRAERAGLIGN